MSEVMARLWCPLCKRDGAEVSPPSMPALCADCAEFPPLERFRLAAGELDRLDRDGWSGGNLSSACGAIARDSAREILRERDRAEARVSRSFAFLLNHSVRRAELEAEKRALRRAAWVLRELARVAVEQGRCELVCEVGPEVDFHFVNLDETALSLEKLAEVCR